MGWFGKKKRDETKPRPVPFEAMNYENQQRERAKTDPVLAQRLIDDERRWREW
jgi:hypothetical protein